MSSRPNKHLRRLSVCGLIVLIFSIAAPFLADAGLDAIRPLMIPGFILDGLVSGNVHSGFAIYWLDYAVGTAGTFLFWMIPTSFIVWLVARRSLDTKDHDA
jgi:hypothetical protein